MKTKSCESDCIPTKILRELLETLLPSITRIINLSLKDCKFPRHWKSAIVRPLLKKENLDHIYKNYRPVSNLPFLSKLLEKVTLQQFMHHCETYDLLPHYQSAYRKHHSCESLVVYLVNNILWNMESMNLTAVAFCDLSAAFDTVDHDLLLDVLKKEYGIAGEALEWYDSYLRPRDFQVCINNDFSDKQPLHFSVPQGSAQGANLFVAYCGSLSKVITHPLELFGFARRPFYVGIIPSQ